MSQILSDGTVIPSYFSVQAGGITHSSGQLDNTALRYGEVRELIYPDDKRSRSRKFIEYNVFVQHRDAGGPSAGTMYYNCSMASLFGGNGDFCRFTLRPGTDFDTGTKVIIGCINGEMSKAVILGGLRDGLTDVRTEPKSQGHNYCCEFNGIRQEINTDGEYSITFKGKTNYDGSLADGVEAASSGTEVKFEVDGSLRLKHGTQQLFLDHAGKQITIEAEDNFGVHSSGTGSLVADESLTLTGKEAVGVNSDGTVKITSAGTKIGGDRARDALVKGSTYWTNEKNMLSSLADQLASAAEALQQAGPAISGSAYAAPALAGAGAAVSGAGGALQAAVSAIREFLGRGDQYLSKKNTTD